MSEGPSITIDAVVQVDCGIVYVNGMELGGVMQAMWPTELASHDPTASLRLGRLRITIEKPS